MEYVGPIIILILLWIRPEYLFLLFYVVANGVLVFLMRDIWIITVADFAGYLAFWLLTLAICFAAGAPFVALFKWIKMRKTGADRRLDKEISDIRAEIAARESQQ